jgi:predicted MPP superfamily phosphohydrolase
VEKHHRSFPSVTRRSFIASVGALMAGGIGAEGLLLEPGRVMVTRHRIGGTPSEAGSALRIAQLSDLHLKGVGRFEERIAARVEELDPHVVLLTGDSIDEASSLPLLAAFLELLPPRSRRYAILGNWEYWSGVERSTLARTYGQADCRLLVNETARLSHGGHGVEIMGLDDLLGGTPDLAQALESASGGANTLLLSHCPAYRDRLDADGGVSAACMLSGHTHGGQVTVGRWAPVRPPGSGAYVSGWYRGKGLDLYVSRGLGTSLIPVRLGSPPEIAFFEWNLG